jgi:hypothetical protein
MRLLTRLTLAALAVLPSEAAVAHFMTQPYLLPVPFWMYAYACGTTLVLTFAVLGYFSGANAGQTKFRTWEVPADTAWASLGRWVLTFLRLAAVACLLLMIVTATFGTLDPTQNASEIMFWIVFMVCFLYLTALVGDVYELVNPWRTILEWLERLGLNFSTARIAYPKWLGYYPAFLFYVLIIWLELFALPNPRNLAWTFLGYSALNGVASWLFGKASWFHFGEMFSVMFRMIGSLAPVQYEAAADPGSWRVRLRMPFVGALAIRPEHMGLVLFVLFMLSSTTYDAVYDTEMWLNFYWKHLIVFAQPLWGTDMRKAEVPLMTWFLIFKRGGMLLSPIVYFALYMLVMAWTKAITKTVLPLRTLALEFITSLVPIAFVYNVSHYYTLMLLEGARLPVVMNDPFGFQWDLFGAQITPPTYIDMAVIWHTQVALILVGHVISVYLAHVAAQRIFPSRKQAIISQIPMLLLMVAYTAIGLYILSLPLGLRQLRE